MKIIYRTSQYNDVKPDGLNTPLGPRSEEQIELRESFLPANGSISSNQVPRWRHSSHYLLCPIQLKWTKPPTTKSSP
jgi:hypothetical protein